MEMKEDFYKGLYETELQKNKELNRELDIYKIRQKEALLKLRTACKHYKMENKNNAIWFAYKMLKGESIAEYSYRHLNGEYNLDLETLYNIENKGE